MLNCNVFNDTTSDSDYIEFETEWIKLNWNGCGRKWAWPIVRYYFGICLVRLRSLFFFFWRDTRPPPPVGHGLLIHEVSRSYTTHHSRQDSSRRVISPTHRPLPDNTQHSQQTDIHDPRLDSNPQPQEASGRRPTPQTAGPPGPDQAENHNIIQQQSQEVRLNFNSGFTLPRSLYTNQSKASFDA